MKRYGLLPSLGALAVLAAALTAVPAARADTSVYFRAGVASGPLSFSVTNEPRVVLIPGSTVYFVEDAPYDVYRYRGYYYAYDDGYWYRARRYGGPYYGVAVTAVPQRVIYVPTRYRTHWVTVPARHRAVVVHEVHRGPHGRAKGHYKHDH